MEKTFTVAGVSTENGTIKFRVANDLKSRVVMLTRCGNTDIELIELPEPMSRTQAAAHLLESPICTEQVAALLKSVLHKDGAAPSAKPVPRAAKPAPAPVEAHIVDDDGFVEPTDERIQVAMSQLAKLNPGMSASALLAQVTATVKHFGDVEPNF